MIQDRGLIGVFWGIQAPIRLWYIEWTDTETRNGYFTCTGKQWPGTGEETGTVPVQLRFSLQEMQGNRIDIYHFHGNGNKLVTENGR